MLNLLVIVRNENKKFHDNIMSGLWTDYKVTSIEDQQKGILPMCDVTETIFYNLRMIIDNKLYSNNNYRAWVVSKVNRISPYGICNATFVQDKMNQHSDYIEKDEDGNIIGMWADYFQSAVAPESIASQNPTSLLSSITSKITYSGASNQVKIGGSKTFTVTFYEDDDLPVEHDIGEWSFFLDGEDITGQFSLSYPAENKVKVRIPSDDELVGKILSIVNTSGDVVSSTEVELIAL